MPPRIAPGRSRGGPPARGRGGGPPSRGGGRGGPPSAAPTGFLPSRSSHITTVGVRRPDFGSSGKPLGVYVNSFETKIPDIIIYHYDGA